VASVLKARRRRKRQHLHRCRKSYLLVVCEKLTVAIQRTC